MPGGMPSGGGGVGVGARDPGAYVYIYIHTHMNTYIYTYIHIYAYACVYTYMCYVCFYTDSQLSSAILTIACFKKLNLIRETLRYKIRNLNLTLNLEAPYKRQTVLLPFRLHAAIPPTVIEQAYTILFEEAWLQVRVLITGSWFGWIWG